MFTQEWFRFLQGEYTVSCNCNSARCSRPHLCRRLIPRVLVNQASNNVAHSFHRCINHSHRKHFKQGRRILQPGRTVLGTHKSAIDVHLGWPGISRRTKNKHSPVLATCLSILLTNTRPPNACLHVRDDERGFGPESGWQHLPRQAAVRVLHALAHQQRGNGRSQQGNEQAQRGADAGSCASAERPCPGRVSCNCPDGACSTSSKVLSDGPGAAEQRPVRLGKCLQSKLEIFT
jgi:hypothetical protein